jgi:hypothetical protein
MTKARSVVFKMMGGGSSNLMLSRGAMRARLNEDGLRSVEVLL